MTLRDAAEALAGAALQDVPACLLAHAVRPGVRAALLRARGAAWEVAGAQDGPAALPGSAALWAGRAARAAQEGHFLYEQEEGGGAWAAAPLPGGPGQPIAAVLLVAYDAPPSPEDQDTLRTLAALGGLALCAGKAVAGATERAQHLMSVSPIGIAAGTPDGQLVEVNDAYLNLLGFSRAEFEAGQIDWLDLTPEREREADAAAFERTFRTGHSGWYEKVMLNRSGQSLPVEVYLLRAEDQDQTLVVGYVRDLREQRRAEALAEQLRRTQADALDAELTRSEGDLARLARQLHTQNTELEARTVVLEGFANLTRDLTRHTDLYALIRRAQQFTLTLLPQGFAVYYEPAGGLWRLKSQVGDLGSPELQRVLDAGISYEGTPNLLIPWQSLQPYYQEAYDHDADGLPEATAQLQTTATLPVLVSGRPRGIFAIGLNSAQPWTRADKVVLESVAQSLGVALEHVEQAQELQRHAAALEESNAALQARTRALEAFADLTRDLAQESDPLTLVGRTQDAIVKLLPHTFSTYYEPGGDLWALQSHRGRFHDPALLARLEAGLPRGGAHNLDEPFATGEARYQHQYDAQSTPAVARAQLSAVRASAALPVMVNGQTRGVLGVGRQEARAWTAADQQLLSAVVFSLQLALDRAEHAQTSVRRTQELERSNRELEQFAYVASHDLQEPLRTITSFAELLARRFNTDADPKVERYARHITEGTARMQQLIQDLLTFARVTADRQPPQRVQPADLLRQVRADLQSQIEQAGATVSAGPLPPVLASPTQLRQLLQNLIGNALKFRAPGRAPQVQVSAQREGDWVRLSVQDNGIGIDPAYHERIFTVFQRLHGREQYLGNGIGLSVARRIVEGHGGQMGVDSVPGQGSTFWFTLPSGERRAEARSGMTGTAASSEGEAQGQTPGG
ncbi:PAS domain S-box protein [Deinococcus sp. HMF7604]|uniref:PAS domain-containing sensor histidine kinase n=1 Tax=Deinococcus betulae TaxID=2873312 RepID=UPI001CCE9EFC|nr:ATP-binding protein [Deinococcus betulae]MBZ9750107.1 PAS domain S-box protein [Deinococcus betulae]